MAQVQDFVANRLPEIALWLANRVDRPLLYQALVDSKLADKGNVDLRKRLRESTAWARFLTEKYNSRDQQEAALRAFSNVLWKYARDDRNDGRVTASIRKAIQAAERSELKTLQREVERLARLGIELRERVLAHTPALLYVAVSSDTARRNVAYLIETMPDVGSSRAMAAALPAPEDRNDKVVPQPGPSLPGGLKAPAHDTSTESKEAGFSVETFLARLKEVGAELEPQPYKIADVETLRRLISLPPTAIVWPPADNILSAFIGLKEALGAATSSAASLKPEIGQLGDVARIVRQSDAVQERGQALDASARQYLETARQHAQEQAIHLDKELQEATTMLLKRMENPETAAEAADGLQALFKQNRALAETHATRVLELAEKVLAAAAPLAASEAAATNSEVIRLVRERLFPELEQLHLKTVRKAAAAKEAAKRSRTALAAAGAALANFNGQIPSANAKRCIDAIKAGDATAAAQEISTLYAPVPIRPTPQAEPEQAPTPPEQAPTPPEQMIPEPTKPAQVPERTSSSLALPKAVAAVEGFVPRSRFTTVPEGADAYRLLEALLARAVREIRRGSFVGLLDNALDIVEIAGRATTGREEWGSIAFALLAAFPASSGASTEQYRQAAERVLDVVSRPATLDLLLGEFYAADELQTAAAERFTHRELLPFASTLGPRLWAACPADAEFLREHLVLGLATGIEFGDEETIVSILVELGRSSGMAEAQLRDVKSYLQSVARGGSERRLIAKAPGWLREGIATFEAAYPKGSIDARPGATDRLKAYVPERVKKSGGFVYHPGSGRLDLALLVTNPNGPCAYAVEIVLPQTRHKFLAEDVVAFVGTLREGERHIVRLPAALANDVPVENLKLQAQLLWRERGSRGSRGHDVPLEAGLAESTSVEIDDFAGAEGKPLILTPEKLRVSSTSVKNTLKDLLRLLGKGPGIAAMIVGRRRRGKTSILETIKQDAEILSRFTVVSDTLEDLPFRTLNAAMAHFGAIFDRVARRLGAEMPKSLSEQLRERPDEAWHHVQMWLETLSERVAKPVGLLLLIDEFHKWLSWLPVDSRGKLLLLFRGLFNRPAQARLSVSIVLSGLSNLVKYRAENQDFQNAFQLYNIKVFESHEADALLRSNQSIEFDTRAVESIRDLAGGNPYLINLLGNMIARRLREHGRPYCFPEDVEAVAQEELQDDESRVRSFVQYLLKQGEEDQAPVIRELPAVVALASTLGRRTRSNEKATADEIVATMRRDDVACDRDTLCEYLDVAVENELLVSRDERYGFRARWLAEWLQKMYERKPLPISASVNRDLVLGKYEIRRSLGAGGQGTVYEAVDTSRFDSRVVLKVYARAPGSPSALQSEARALSKVEHNGVVRCLDYGVDPEKGDVIVLEPVKGDTLRAILRDRPSYAQQLAGSEGKLDRQVKLLEQLASALGACHTVNVVHKDLKPENIMVEQSAGLWLPKLVDFGLASYLDPNSQDVLTSGSYTPGYVAPERYRGQPRKAWADVYSLGVVAYELLTGQSPFPSDPIAAREAQLAGQFVPLKQRRPEVPQRLSELVAAMLASDPTTRPSSLALAEEFRLALESSDWLAAAEAGEKALYEDDEESALSLLEKAIFSAPATERTGAVYVSTLENLLLAAEERGALFLVGPRLVQPLLVVAAATAEGKGAKLLTEFLQKTLVANVVGGTRDAQQLILRTVVEGLFERTPFPAGQATVEFMLKDPLQPAIWESRDDVFLLGVNYRAASLVRSGLIEQWCLRCCQLIRERGEPLVGCLLWLRRAERLGISGSADYRQERERVEGLVNRTADPPSLPPVARVQESASRVIGDDERGHLAVAQVERWAARLMHLYPHVQAVKRVRREGRIPLWPTRILEDTPAIHSAAAQGLAASRLIAAVLDSSFCRDATTVLRINLILEEGTTPAQRENFIDLLRKDTSLFGEVP